MNWNIELKELWVGGQCTIWPQDNFITSAKWFILDKSFLEDKFSADKQYVIILLTTGIVFTQVLVLHIAAAVTYNVIVDMMLNDDFHL